MPPSGLVNVGRGDLDWCDPPRHHPQSIPLDAGLDALLGRGLRGHQDQVGPPPGELGAPLEEALAVAGGVVALGQEGQVVDRDHQRRARAGDRHRGGVGDIDRAGDVLDQRPSQRVPPERPGLIPRYRAQWESAALAADFLAGRDAATDPAWGKSGAAGTGAVDA